MKKFPLILLISTFFCLSGFSQNVSVIEPELMKVLEQKDNEMIRINIVLNSQIDARSLKNDTRGFNNAETKRQFVVQELKNFAENSQRDIITILEEGEKSSAVKDIVSHWISNTITCSVSKDYIYLLSNHPDISIIGGNESQFLLWDEKSESIDIQRGPSKIIGHVKANKVWDLGYTGKGVTVAILDTGINIHTDIVNNLWDGGEEYPNHGYNTYEKDHNLSDVYGHGTHCAGIICGTGVSGTKTGIAPDATLMCVKVMDNNGKGDAESICSGIEFAIEHGADVLNMSLGFSNAAVATRATLRNAYINAMEANIAIITAVGNDGMFQSSCPAPNNVRVPGGCPPPWLHPDQQDKEGGLSACIAVGAVTDKNAVADFSSFGPFTWQNTSFRDYQYNGTTKLGLIRPDVCAPGSKIVSCDPNKNNGYITMDGTSQAAPCVTGIVCLMLQKNPELTPAQICEILETTAVKLSETKNNYTGSGCVDAFAAINATEEYDYINESIIDNNVNIYPNPAENEIHISSEDRIEEVTIYNVNGQQTIVNGQQSTTESIINISSLNAGVYFIKIKTDNQIITKPFIKK